LITIATLAVSPDRAGAVWVTGRMGRGSLTHTSAVLFHDVDDEYDRLQDTIADRYVYAPMPDAAEYARSIGVRPATIRNIREPARELQEFVRESHRRQVCNDPSVQHAEPRMRPIPSYLPQPGGRQALARAPAAANYLLAVWQAWLDAELERASRHHLADPGERTIRLLPDEFVLAEQPARVPSLG
jgi:hypothetical protein